MSPPLEPKGRSPAPRATHASPVSTRDRSAPATGLTRRRFLASSTAAAIAAGATVALPGCRGGPTSRGRVVIVGMGLAGLVAAYELERHNFSVVLLEARDRLGGRVLTAHTPFYRRQTTELGAEFIDRNHRMLLAYLHRLRLGVVDLRGQTARLSGIVYRNGERQPRAQVVTPRVQADIDRFHAHVDSLARAVDPADPPAGAAASLDDRPVAAVLDELALGADARRVLEREIRDDHTVEPERLSLLFYAARRRLYAGQPVSGTAAFRIDGGNASILDALSAELSARAKLNSPVHRIEQRPDGVRVHARSGREVDADFCVVTVPLPLLARIEFRPRLPTRLAEAAARLQYGSATKVALQYGRRFWLRQGLDGHAVTDLPIGTTWEATRHEPAAPGILMAYASGADGARLGAIEDSERVYEASRQMERVFPRARGILEASATAAWSTDEYSLGSYAAYAPGQVTRYWRALRAPVGRVYLAGEHCDAFTGYMEGAVRSGRRTALAIAHRAG